MPGVGHRCFVGGLAWGIDDKSLQCAFAPYGDVVEAKIMSDRESGRSRGFGFVSFSSEQSMWDAVEGMNGHNLQGRNITVQAQPRCGGHGDRYNRGAYEGHREAGFGGHGGWSIR